MAIIPFIFLLFIHVSLADDDILVKLPDGTIRGKLESTVNGSEYYAFYQIPYAAPPINEKRFKEPEDPQPWEGILNATASTKSCPQGGSDGQTEDCLYLSVNVPANAGIDKIPVLLWIHGGGFTSGSIAAYNPKYLMEYDIIVVQVQYRLGPLGFLTTMDGVIPANLGLKDQRKAVNWVYSNIEYFGGDPTKITIMGESAGGMSVSYLLLDTSLEGKISGAIVQSGSSGSRLLNVVRSKEYAYTLGSLLNSTFDNSSQSLLDILQNASVDEIFSAAALIPAMSKPSSGLMAGAVWATVIENEKFEKNPVATYPALKSFQSGNFVKVPTMIGFNSEECLTGGIVAINATPALTQMYMDDPSLLADESYPLTPEEQTAFGEEMLKQYEPFNETYGAFIRYSTDTGFTNGVLAQAKLSYQHTPVYVYQFSYVGEYLGDLIFWALTGQGRTSVPGAEKVTHAEDLTYVWSTLFGIPDGDNISEMDLLTRKRFLKFLTNFVKYQNPTPEEDEELANITWPTIASDDIEYLNFNETLEIESNPRNFKTLREIFEKYVGYNYGW